MTGKFLFPASKFPIVLEAQKTTGEVVWTHLIEKPGSDGFVVISVPPLRQLLGHWVNVVIRYGDGTVETE